MTLMVTHIVEYSQWYRSPEGDWDFYERSDYAFSQEHAEKLAAIISESNSTLPKTVKIVEVEKPFPAGSEYDD